MTPLTQKLLTTMSAVSGFSSRAILSRKRCRPLPALRWMIGRELIKNHYTNSLAARELKLNHATLLHGIKTLGSMGTDKSRGWQLEIEIEEKFKQLIINNKQDDNGQQTNCNEKE